MSIRESLRRDDTVRAAQAITRENERREVNAKITALFAAFDDAWAARMSGDVQAAKRGADTFRDLANHAASLAMDMHACPGRRILSGFLQIANVAFDLSAAPDQRDRAHTGASWLAQMLRIERGLG